MDHVKEFLKKIDRLTHKHDRARLFSDFITMASSSLIVKACPQEAERSEAEYMALVPRYTREELTEFGQLLGLTALALEARPCDFLGQVFMQAEISNSHMGQFFTPYELSLLIARMTIEDVDPAKELITVQEPACGSGGMVIAFCEAAREKGINYQLQTYTVAVDLSEVAARMAYIQLSLLGIPAHVVWGNSLSLEVRREWPTFGYWAVMHKVNRWRRGASHVEPEPAPAPTVTLNRQLVQAEMF